MSLHIFHRIAQECTRVAQCLPRQQLPLLRCGGPEGGACRAARARILAPSRRGRRHIPGGHVAQLGTVLGGTGVRPGHLLRAVTAFRAADVRPVLLRDGGVIRSLFIDRGLFGGALFCHGHRNRGVGLLRDAAL